MSLDLITFAARGDIKQRSALSVRVYFRDSSAFADAVPTNIYYRLDDDGTGIVLLDWTQKTPVPVLPVNYVDITLTPDQNRLINAARDLERKTLTVMTDRGLATQQVAAFGYIVRELGWYS